MNKLNKDRDTIISKKIDLSNCNYDNDLASAAKRTMEQIDSEAFQSWSTCLDLNVSVYWRDYIVDLYREWDVMHVWINWNFAYEVLLDGWRFYSAVRALFKNWRWVPGIEMIYHWDWNDPELVWNWVKANYREIEDNLYEDFIDWLKESNKYNHYCEATKSTQDNMFDDWLFDNYYKIVEIFLQLRDSHEY